MEFYMNKKQFSKRLIVMLVAYVVGAGIGMASRRWVEA